MDNYTPEQRRDISRFWMNVEKTQECWWWRGVLRGNGYGGVWFGNKMRLAHRVSWMIESGEMPKLCVLHSCDNKTCVRPSHLFLGTAADNAADRTAKGRGRPGKSNGSDNGSAKLTEGIVKTIREEYSNGTVQTALALKYGVAQQSISRILRRLNWRHI